ncbi:MAG TPA: SRPBCC family protein, partial [Thermoleophilia bacterium]|nr:SRPBCC family protein [Thermoleophilia bacterium]
GQAPAVARTEVEIEADRETVWRLLTDLEAWPRWKSDVSSLSLRGPLVPGSTFVWKTGRTTITSTLRQVEAPGRIAWTGRTMGIRAIDVFTLEERDGRTRVVEEESWEGAIVRLLSGRLHRTLQSSIESGLRSLKAEAERRSAPRAA